MLEATPFEHTVAPPALAPFDGMDALVAELDALCRSGRSDAQTYASLGNLLVREGRYFDAFEAYAAAASLDPGNAPAHWMCAELAHILSDEANSREHRAAALALQRVYPDPLPVGDRTPVLLLLRDAPYSANAPLELLLDRRAFAVHKYYVEGPPDRPLPPRASEMVAFGFADDGSAAIDAVEILPARGKRVNDAARLPLLARDRLAATLSGIRGLHGVAAIRADAALARTAPLPFLIRPIDSHAGDGLALIDDELALDAHLGRFPAEMYFISPFIDYRSADGLYRKYRIMFVDGVAYPYHASMSPRWMVHYLSSPMREHAWMREEELAFLREPETVFPRWHEITNAVAAAIGLDYFGIDAARLGEGEMLVFEADSAMLVHDEDERDVFAYKRPFVGAIRDALSALLRG